MRKSIFWKKKDFSPITFDSLLSLPFWNYIGFIEGDFHGVGHTLSIKKDT